MKLPVLPEDDTSRPWYADGLDFTCTQCGNCCTGPPGFVWVSDEELSRLADHLQLTTQETARRYCRPLAGRLSLKENRNAEGNHDCVFLLPLPAEQADSQAPGKPPAKPKYGCSIYPVRPLQCRTWPFWDGTLSSPERWQTSADRCDGINHGRHYTREQIEALRDATDWPEESPSSE